MLPPSHLLPVVKVLATTGHVADRPEPVGRERRRFGRLNNSSDPDYSE